MSDDLKPLQLAGYASEVLRDYLATVIIDSREQTPLSFTRLPSRRTDEDAGLTSGDYTIAGFSHLFAIERKPIDDLVSCCANSNRDRFERELHRLRGYRFARVVICGTRGGVGREEYRSKLSAKAVLSTIAAFETRYNVPFVFAGSPAGAAILVETWAYWVARENLTSISHLAKELRASPPCHRINRPSAISSGNERHSHLPVRASRQRSRRRPATPNAECPVYCYRGDAIIQRIQHRPVPCQLNPVREAPRQPFAKAGRRLDWLRQQRLVPGACPRHRSAYLRDQRQGAPHRQAEAKRVARPPHGVTLSVVHGDSPEP